MAGLGRKEWSPGDVLTASDVNGYLMDQSVMVFAGTAARASAIPTPSAGMVAYSTATSLQVYNGSAWVGISTGYGVATGGSSSNITVGGTAYTLLTFTTDGTLTVTQSGLFDVLLFGGGGAAYRFDGGSHGGGAGGAMVQQTIYLSANQSVVVGAGAAAAASLVKSQAKPSSIGTGPNAITAVGGNTLTAAGDANSNGEFGSQCGSIGGGTSSGTNNSQGNKGGNSTANTNGGGGGSSQAVGGNGSSTTGGAGAAGYDVNAFTGAGSLFKGSGGGGGGSVTGGAAGSSLGNAGTTSTGNTPAANTAAGGGGGNGANTTGSGASGIVYVRFRV